MIFEYVVKQHFEQLSPICIRDAHVICITRLVSRKNCTITMYFCQDVRLWQRIHQLVVGRRPLIFCLQTRVGKA